MTVSKILGCASATNERPRDEFYQTPAQCTRAFLDYEHKKIPPWIWEPFCGEGAISKVVGQYGYGVRATDLNHRSVGTNRVDFLMERTSPFKGLGPSGIISNPPFNLAHQIIEHAIDVLDITYIALLLKADFFNSAKGHKLFHKHRPARILALSWRPDFRNQGSPTMNCSWFVWESPHDQETTFNVIEKPAG